MSRVRTLVATELLLVLGLVLFVGVAYLVELAFGLHDAVQLSPLTSLVVAGIPAGLWLAYFYAQDRHEPEPKHFVLGVYLLGLFVCGPLSQFAITQVAPTSPLAAQSVDRFGADRLVHAFLVVGLAQELCKYLAVRYTVYLSPEFDEPMDGVIYMTAAGIGFATWQNYHYFQGLEGNVFLATGAATAVVTTLAHACFAGVQGYGLGRAKFSPVSSTTRSLILLGGLLVATLLNGQFTLVESIVSQAGMAVEPWRGVAYAAGFAAAVFFVISILMRRLLALSPFRPEDDLPATVEPDVQRAPLDEEARERAAAAAARAALARRGRATPGQGQPSARVEAPDDSDDAADKTGDDDKADKTGDDVAADKTGDDDKADRTGDDDKADRTGDDDKADQAQSDDKADQAQSDDKADQAQSDDTGSAPEPTSDEVKK